jgi:hypothetical protein
MIGGARGLAITGFQLHTLGWRAFQDMGQVVLRDVLGQELEVYSDTNDIGQDGAFAGRAKPALDGALRGIHGAVFAQMKHTSRAGAHLTLSDLADELPKVEKLVDRGLCDSYILLTNFQVTGKVAAEVNRAARTWRRSHHRPRGRMALADPRQLPPAGSGAAGLRAGRSGADP